MLTAIVAAAALTAAPTHEITVSPTVEWSAKFTHHEGTNLRYAFSPAPGMGVFGAWREHWSAGTSEFNSELFQKVREEAQDATQTLLRRAFVAGLFADPFKGEWADARALFVRVSVGAGVGMRDLDVSPFGTQPAFADAGPSMTGFGALEIHYRLNEHIAVTAALDDFVFSSYLTELNGCNLGDLEALDSTARAIRAPETARVSDSCRVNSLPGRQTPIALSAVRDGGSDIRQVRTASIGLSVTF